MNTETGIPMTPTKSEDISMEGVHSTFNMKPKPLVQHYSSNLT